VTRAPDVGDKGAVESCTCMQHNGLGTNVRHVTRAPALRANQRSSEPINGHPRSSTVIQANQGSSEPINGHPSQSMVIRANPWSMVIGGNCELISIRGSQWPSMAISELAHLRAVLIRYSSDTHQRSSEAIRGHQRSSDFRGHRTHHVFTSLITSELAHLLRVVKVCPVPPLEFRKVRLTRCARA
jgi:hypothetical protein